MSITCGGATIAEMKTVLIACIVALLASSGPQAIAADTNLPARSKPTRYWFLQGPRLEAQAMATDRRAVAFFSDPSRIVVYPAIAAVPPPSSWHVMRWRKYTTIQKFQHDLDTHSVGDGVQIVGYDAEQWALTPTEEQDDPAGYTEKFAQLAHSHGYKFIATPAINLMMRKYHGKNKYVAFVDDGLAKSLAPYVDFYHIQAQGLQQNVEGSQPSFKWFVEQIAAQVHSANPNAIVTVGISTNTPGSHTETSPDDIAASVRAAESIPGVSGYWLNVVGGKGSVASDALSRIDPL